MASGRLDVPYATQIPQVIAGGCRSGIYCIRHADGRVYIGSAINIPCRLSHHRGALQRQKHRNKRLQTAWDVDGIMAFHTEILEFVPDKNQLVEREQFWIDHLSAYRDGFNMAPVAGSNLGRPMSEEAKALLRIRAIGRTLSAETKRKISDGGRGLRRSEQTRQRISAAKKGVPMPQWVMEKLRASRAGKPPSDHQRATASRVHRGEGNSAAKISEQDARTIKKLISDGRKLKSIAAELNISIHIINLISSNRTWKHVAWPNSSHKEAA